MEVGRGEEAGCFRGLRRGLRLLRWRRARGCELRVARADALRVAVGRISSKL